MFRFDENIGIDESLIGRKIKYNFRNPAGHIIWIFGTVHKYTGFVSRGKQSRKKSTSFTCHKATLCSVNKIYFGQLGRLLRIK